MASVSLTDFFVDNADSSGRASTSSEPDSFVVGALRLTQTPATQRVRLRTDSGKSLAASAPKNMQRHRSSIGSDARLIERRVSKYDGQSIWIGDTQVYEFGNFLGGGCAGSVYEALEVADGRPFAVKVVNPIPYKLVPATTLQRCVVAVKGADVTNDIMTGKAPLEVDHVWWLVNPATKQLIAAHYDSRFGSLRELTLKKCEEVWGLDPIEVVDDVAFEAVWKRVNVKGMLVSIPRVPRKYIRFLRSRKSILREITSMLALESHPNVLQLHDVVEYLQPTKDTIFLVLELAQGGELFDRIKIDEGTDERVALQYFRQLLAGIAHCHVHGVCHRDLKPENLLLADGPAGTVLKIADFGLSALMEASAEEQATAAASGEQAAPHATGDPDHQPAQRTQPVGSTSPALRRLRSVVGSPHYVAPEVVQESTVGYDGFKADAWSAGVILYAMLAGNLPFGRDLLLCPRFQRLRQWMSEHKATAMAQIHTPAVQGAASTSGAASGSGVDSDWIPLWFFPPHFSPLARDLVARLLQPNPDNRLSVIDALGHAWVQQLPMDKPGSAELSAKEAARRGSSSSASSSDEPCEATVCPEEPCEPQQGQQQEQDEDADGRACAGPVHCKLFMSPPEQAWKQGQDGAVAADGHLNSPFIGDQDVVEVRQRLPGLSLSPPAAPAFAPAGKRVGGASPIAVSTPTVEAVDETPASSATVFAFMSAPTPTGAPEMGPVVPGPDADVDNADGNGNDPVLAEREGNSDEPLLTPGAVHVVDDAFVDPPATTSRRSAWPPSPPLAPTTFLHHEGGKDDGEHEWHAVMLDEDEDAQNDVPLFHGAVQRSSRFTTTLPAMDVLNQVASVLHAAPRDIVADSADALDVQIGWNEYRVELFSGRTLLCTVQVYLVQGDTHMVEFSRGELDIFQFKRFFQQLRDSLAGVSRSVVPGL